MNYLVSLSGGIDSATALGILMKNAESKNDTVIVVSFSYPSKHNEYELEAAKDIALWYGVRHEIIDVSSVFGVFKSSLLEGGEDIPEGHYTDDSMSSTVVPFRNPIFALIAAGLGESLFRGQPFTVVLGVHAGDHPIYPDCRPESVNSLRQLLVHASEREIELSAPLLHIDKTTIVKHGLERDVPYELTRTCYKPQDKPCGKCGSCVERLEAFRNNGVEDPADYA